MFKTQKVKFYDIKSLTRLSFENQNQELKTELAHKFDCTGIELWRQKPKN